MNINIEELSAALVDAKPRDFNFAEDGGETWDQVLPDLDTWSPAEIRRALNDLGMTERAQELDNLTAALQEEYQELEFEDFAEALDRLLDDYREELLDAFRYDSPQFEPMMNYLYPIEVDDPEQAQSVLYRAHLPVCVVVVKDNGEWQPYLALTGGGMNLSWEICEAYMRLGFLPPVHFCDLPAIAGRGQSGRDQWIVQACLRSVEAMRIRLNWTERSLKSILEEATVNQ